MIQGIIGRKKGMTQIFTDDGRVIPVTVIETPKCRVAQVKTAASDGYTAVQIGVWPAKPKRIGKPRLGHLKKHGDLPPLSRLVEFRVPSVEDLRPGQEISPADVFSEGDRVDVRGTSKGRGFAGVIKRHKFAQGDMSHGGMSRRRPGSIGQCATPSRVFRGKRMAGHMGNRNVTVRNLELVRIDAEGSYILVSGAVPGPMNGDVRICKTKKGFRVAKYRTKAD